MVGNQAKEVFARFPQAQRGPPAIFLISTPEAKQTRENNRRSENIPINPGLSERRKVAVYVCRNQPLRETFAPIDDSVGLTAEKLLPDVTPDPKRLFLPLPRRVGPLIFPP